MNKITIGMPVFNDVQFIEASLKSILNQSESNFVLIISDDGSTDGSDLICLRYAQQDSRIVYIKQPINLGISKNMEFLLQKAQTPYFMWAADDDLWHTNFISILLNLLETNSLAVSSFCIYQEIDEIGGNFFSHPTDKNYSQPNKHKRLVNFIKNYDDGFGYGIFKTEYIKDVKFPIWWWPNKKTPYNNIYPTLCYYLAQGDFVYYNKEILFWKRKKSQKFLNYSHTGQGNSIQETFAFIIRRFNLISFSTKLIFKSSGFLVAFKIYYYLFCFWFIKSSFEQLLLPIKSLFRKIKLLPKKQ